MFPALQTTVPTPGIQPGAVLTEGKALCSKNIQCSISVKLKKTEVFNKKRAV
jgi:hypothetical protein